MSLLLFRHNFFSKKKKRKKGNKGEHQNQRGKKKILSLFLCILPSVTKRENENFLTLHKLWNRLSKSFWPFSALCGGYSKLKALLEVTPTILIEKVTDGILKILATIVSKAFTQFLLQNPQNPTFRCQNKKAR